MTVDEVCKLIELYAACPKCGCDTIGDSTGTLEFDTSIGHFKRTCNCGWQVEIEEADNG
jgi:hypothetical protein